MAPQEGLSHYNKIYIIVASAVYGALTSGVAINFPAGSIVAFCWVIVYGILGLGYYRCLILRSIPFFVISDSSVDNNFDDKILSLNYISNRFILAGSRQEVWYGERLFARPVIDCYILGHIFCLIIVIGWVINVRGFLTTRGDVDD